MGIKTALQDATQDPLDSKDPHRDNAGCGPEAAIGGVAPAYHLEIAAVGPKIARFNATNCRQRRDSRSGDTACTVPGPRQWTPITGIMAHSTVLAAVDSQQPTATLPLSSPSRLEVLPHEYSGLDPEWRGLWNSHGASLMRADEVTIEEYRLDPAKYSFTYPTYSGPEVFHVEDHNVPVTKPIGEIAVRVYSPGGHGPFPVHVNFHGGGWVLGGLKSEAAWCRHMCNKANVKVIDVDYRMGPEHKFPTAIYDCWDAVKWVIGNPVLLNIDPVSVSFGGLSAGGHMSAVLAHFARDEGVDIKLHLMIVPATDMRYCSTRLEQLTPENCPYESARLFTQLPWGGLGREQWFLKYWLGESPEDQDLAFSQWIMTPVLAPNFKNLPRAHVVTAEFDLERDEGEFYGQVLKDAGNEVTMKRYIGCPHAFAHYNHPARGLTKSFEFIDDTAELLQHVHYGNS